VQQQLLADGLLRRYRSEQQVARLAAGEGTFLPCSFWLVDALTLDGDHDHAAALFERLIGLRNDLGLLAEEYDPTTGRQLGNYPQAFSHIALVNSAFNLANAEARHRSQPTRG
jgi:GH15 family glucan-1,4-alpha-glucosidase